MEQLLVQLSNKAHLEQVVATHSLTDGTELLAYPLQQGVLIGMGFNRELGHNVSQENLLKRRASNMARFGTWLPTLLNDGSCYVVRRIDFFNPGSNVPVLSLDDLLTAKELLS